MKRMLVNQKANKEMKIKCLELGITRCERCGSGYFLSFAHRHKRRMYYNKPISWLYNINQFLLLCIKCHEEIEYDVEKTREIFNFKRGKDIFDE